MMSNLTGQQHNTTEEHHCSEKQGSIYKDLEKGLNEQTCDVKSFTWNSNVRTNFSKIIWILYNKT